MSIKSIKKLREYLPELCDVLTDCVETGASVGFLPPLSTAQAREYWQGLENELDAGSRLLIVATQDNCVVGTVQLAMSSKTNGRHRAEVEKLMVHSKARGLGLSKLLMQELEQQAQLLGRHLLVLDTREGDLASQLYKNLGYQQAGRIPGFALSASGELDATIYFYKQLI